jgi:hypothetical protein
MNPCDAAGDAHEMAARIPPRRDHREACFSPVAAALAARIRTKVFEHARALGPGEHPTVAAIRNHNDHVVVRRHRLDQLSDAGRWWLGDDSPHSFHHG